MILCRLGIHHWQPVDDTGNQILARYRCSRCGREKVRATPEMQKWAKGEAEDAETREDRS